MNNTIENTTLVCYADDQMLTSQQLCIRSALEKGGIQCYAEYSPDTIKYDDGFYSRNERILEATQRGGGKGWWLWKPYICLDMLMRLNCENNTGELKYLIYADAGVEFIDSMQHVIDSVEATGQDIFLFGNLHTHLLWCKSKVLQAMLPQWYDIDNIHTYEQVQASVIVFKVSEHAVDFARRWLAWSEIPGFIDDSDNTGIVDNGYRDHRNDQAILTNLAIADSIPMHWWPAQYGQLIKEHYDDSYPQLFYHHRWRETDWQDVNITIDQFMKLPKA